jgi:hypothetical protein
MRRNLSLFEFALGLGLLLWSQPLGRAVAAGSADTKFGRADAAMAQSERPSAPRLAALRQGLRPRLCRLTSDATHALPAGTLAFSDPGSAHFSCQPAEVALVEISVGARIFFPRAPPLSA